MLLVSPLSAEHCDAPGALWRWAAFEGDSCTESGCAALEHLPPAKKHVLVWPTNALSWHRVQLPKVFRGKLRPVLIGLLEERLLVDPDTLHYACDAHHEKERANGQGTWVAAIAQTLLGRARDQLTRAGRNPDRIIPAHIPNTEAAVWLDRSPICLNAILSGPYGVVSLPLPEGADTAGSLWCAIRSMDVADASGTPIICRHIEAEMEVGQSSHPQVIWSCTAGDHPWSDALQSHWDLSSQDSDSSRSKRLSSVSATWKGAVGWLPFRWGVAALFVANLVGLPLSAWKVQNNLDQLKATAADTVQAYFPKVQLVLNAPLQMAREVELLRQAQGEPAPGDLEHLLAEIGRLPSDVHSPIQRIVYDRSQLKLEVTSADAQIQEPLESAIIRAGWNAGDNSIQPTELSFRRAP